MYTYYNKDTQSLLLDISIRPPIEPHMLVFVQVVTTEIAEKMEITLPTTTVVLSVWNRLAWKSGVLLTSPVDVLGISVSRILCTYSHHILD